MNKKNVLLMSPTIILLLAIVAVIFVHAKPWQDYFYRHYTGTAFSEDINVFDQRDQNNHSISVRLKVPAHSVEGKNCSPYEIIVSGNMTENFVFKEYVVSQGERNPKDCPSFDKKILKDVAEHSVRAEAYRLISRDCRFARLVYARFVKGNLLVILKKSEIFTGCRQ